MTTQTFGEKKITGITIPKKNFSTTFKNNVNDDRGRLLEGEASMDKLENDKSMQQVDKSMKDRLGKTESKDYQEAELGEQVSKSEAKSNEQDGDLEEDVNESEDNSTNRDRLFERDDELKGELSELDQRVEDMAKEIHEEEDDYVNSDAGSSSEDGTELAHRLTERDEEYYEIYRSTQQVEDEVMFDENDEPRSRSINLDTRVAAVEHHIETVEDVIRQGADSYDTNTDKLMEDLEEHKEKLVSFRKEFNDADFSVPEPSSSDSEDNQDMENTSDSEDNQDMENTSDSKNHEDMENTPNISSVAGPSSSNTENQKGSLLDDYADTSTEPMDYFGGDD